LLSQGGKRRITGLPNFCCAFALSSVRIVRAGILWWLAVLGGDNCHSGGPVQHPGFVGLAPAETQSGAALLLLGSVHNIEALGFLSFIDSDGMSFF
jgi:hypothetical protein